MGTGYIGLGMMGAAMTQRLVDVECPPTVFDLDEATLSASVGRGASGASSVAQVVEMSEIVSVCVPAASHVEAVMSEIIAAPGASGTTVLIHSTVSPATMIEAAERGRPSGVAVHDACVAGGDAAAADGTLAIFAGGVSQLAPEVTELLGLYASRVIDAGPVGSGAALKIGVNVMTYAQQVAAAVAFDVVEGAHGSTDALVDAWRHIGQLGALTERFLPMLGIPPEHITGDFRNGIEHTVTQIMQKDLALATDLGGAGERQLAEVSALLSEVLPRVYGLER